MEVSILGAVRCAGANKSGFCVKDHNGIDAWKKSIRSYQNNTQYVSADHVDWLEHNKSRIFDTLKWIQKRNTRHLSMAEIGPGGIGLCAFQNFNCSLDAYDCTDWFKSLYSTENIPWKIIDFNQSFSFPENQYDIILFCEVIEHLCQYPIEVLTKLKMGLKPGGILFVSTPNLIRLSNRLRMVMGREIFSEFSQESLVMGHLREYTVPEMVNLFEKSGFKNIESEMKCYPDTRSPQIVQWAYKMCSSLFPRLSNIYFIWGGR